MAEVLLKARMPESWRGEVEVSSAGMLAWDGQPAASTAVDVLSDLGIDLSPHRARHLNLELVLAADLIVVMAEEHARAVVELDREAASKVLKLGELDPEREMADIADPIGGDQAVYTASRDEIDRLISRLIDYISDRFNIDS
jgi:protein-tyrosine-phosphatase